MNSPANPAAVLDTIDNAISDYELSSDAMRWTPDPQPATGGLVTSGPDIARFVDAAGLPGLPLEPWQRRLLDHAFTHIASPTLDAHVASARLAMAFDRVRLGVTAVAHQYAEAMKGMSLALAPLLDEVHWGKPRRPERVSRIRRAYRAKRRGW